MHPKIRLFSGNNGYNLGFSSAKEILEAYARLSGETVDFIDESGKPGKLFLRLEIVANGVTELYQGWRNVKSVAYSLKRSQENKSVALNLQPTSS